MAKYYVNGLSIEIPYNLKPFNTGSEGNLYLMYGKLFKIYHNHALNEGFFGNKEDYHKDLVKISSNFKSYVLQDSLIYNTDGDYVGYTVRPIIDKNNNEIHTKEGLIEEEWDSFINNLLELEKETESLSKYNFLLIDMGYHNVKFSKEQHRLYMIDPGRYRYWEHSKLDYLKMNKKLLDSCITELLRHEISYFDITNPINALSLIHKLKNDKGDISYAEYFLEHKCQYDTPKQYFLAKRVDF